MKKWLCLMLIGLVITISSCEQTRVPQKEPLTVYSQKDDVVIGMSFDSFVIERWQRERDVFVSKAKDLGASVNVQNANGEVEEQIRQIEYFIEKKMDAIVIICIDAEKLSDVVARAKAAGIKVIAYDRMIRNADADLYISFDNEMVGRMMATAIADSNSTNNQVLMLSGPTTDNNVAMIETGFLSVANSNNLEIVARVYADGWKPELASEYLNEHYELLDDIGGIMCGNDSIASQVVRVLSERRIAGKIPVVGQDADLEACQRIVEGTQLMTIYKPVEKLASAAAEYTIRLIEGEELNDTVIINDGTYDIPYVTLMTYAVDKEHMQEIIIDSGFHMKEDVYLNVPELMP